MSNPLPEKNSNILNLNFSEVEKIGLTSQETLRKTVGWLGMLLPVLLYLCILIDTGYKYPMESISHYYFTRAGSIFCMIVSLMAVFLIIYKGREPVDFFLSFTAGIFALLVVLMPTGNISSLCCDADKIYSVTVLKQSSFRVGFHYIAAAVFLLSLAGMSLFVFTKSDKATGQRGRQKTIRNRLYRTCGIIMILAVLVIFFGGYLEWVPRDFYTTHQFTFWLEAFAVEAFGISWLVKGKAVLKD